MVVSYFLDILTDHSEAETEAFTVKIIYASHLSAKSVNISSYVNTYELIMHWDHP